MPPSPSSAPQVAICSLSCLWSCTVPCSFSHHFSLPQWSCSLLYFYVVALYLELKVSQAKEKGRSKSREASATTGERERKLTSGSTCSGSLREWGFCWPLLFFFFLILIICWLPWVFAAVCRLFSSCRAHEPCFSCSSQAPRCGGFSLQSTRSRVQRALEQLWAWAQLPHSKQNPPGPGIEPMSPALSGGFPTTKLPGRSLATFSWKKGTERLSWNQVSLSFSGLLPER